MGAAVFLIEILFFSSAFCVLHALKLRLGLAPLYMLFGLFESFLFFLSRANPPVMGHMLFGYTSPVSYILILPLMLGLMLIIYVLEGSPEARRFILAVVVLFVVHGLLDVLFNYHATHPPAGHASGLGNPIIQYSNYQRLSSLVAFTADAVTLIVVYQFLVNRLPKLPLVLPLFVAFVLAMIVDGLVFGGMQGDPTHGSLLLVEKAQAGLAAGIPIAVYLGWRIRQQGLDVSLGRVRKTFDLLDLRIRVEKVERELEAQREQLEVLKDSFGRFVPPSVVEAIAEDPRRLELGGEQRDLTVLFADIRGYSTLSEKLSPTETIALLNRYFEAVTDVIFNHYGMINEFEGDGILAIFGAPLKLENHAEHAVRAGLGMLDAVVKLNQACDADGTSAIWKSVGIDRFSIRIGLHSGPAVVGNIGTSKRIKYAVIGDTVNTASRIEGLNKELSTSMLLSAATRECLRDGLIPLIDEGSHPVKGKGKEVHVFTVDPLKNVVHEPMSAVFVLPKPD